MKPEKQSPAVPFQRAVFWRTALVSLALTLAIEMLSRHSPLAGAWFMLSNPAVFCYNALLIFFTLSIGLFFRHRLFAQTLPSVVWLGLGAANCIVLFFRITPLEAIDFAILRTGIAISTIYMTVWQLVLIGVGAVLLIAAFVLLWRKAPKKQRLIRQALAQALGAAILISGFGAVFLASGQLTKDFSDTNAAYDENGFCFSLLWSMVDRGVAQPESYSEESVEEILSALPQKSSAAPEVKPNIIFLQLESFFDPHYVDGLNFETNPVPVFSALKTRCSTGLLAVPGVGNGTANTEFEVITGMNLDHFGAGEYPFQTILLSEACESMAFNLKELGYTAHAIHNHTGTFYNRNTVYASMGFDDFEPVEYMTDVTRNIIGWSNDSVLTREINLALDSTEGPDYVYAISVQLHGKYPDEPIEGAPIIRVGGVEDPAEKAAYEYYLGQLHQVDSFLSSLVQSLSKRSEPTVLVMYGDHLPSLALRAEQFTRSTLFQTEYLVWANYDLPKQDCDLPAYQLGAHVLQMLGIDNGLITKLHQYYSENPDYQQALQTLEYDMLYGDHLVYGGESPYQKSDMRLGILPITITGASCSDGTLVVSGENFTEASRIRVNHSVCSTKYVSSSELRAPLSHLNSGDSVVVEQAADILTVLGETNAYIVGGSDKGR